MFVLNRLLASVLLVTPATTAGAQTRSRESDRPPAIGFGAALALTADELLVGRTGEPPGFPMPATHAGAVHRFRRGADGTWTETGTIQGSDTRLEDGFGSALAVDDTWLVVGAPKNGAGGAAYVFEKRGGTWTQTARLASPHPTEGDEFGAGVAIGGGGTMVLVGAPGSDSARGAAFSFRRDPATGNWSAGTRLGGGSSPQDRFGNSVALDRMQAVIGMPGPLALGGFGPPGPRPRPGAAVGYRMDASGAWAEVGRLIPGNDTVPAYGVAVQLSGGEALVGAPLLAGATGAVYRFRADPAGRWTLDGRIQAEVPTRGTGFGLALARAGNTLVVGAPLASQAVGEAHVFARQGDAWVHRQRLAGQPSGLGVLFGMGVAARDDLVVIGAPMAEFFEGAAYSYARDPGTGEWRSSGTVVDKPAGLPVVTGREVPCAGGAAANFPCEQVDLLSFVPTADLGAKRGIMLNDIWGWTDPETRREYAIVGRMDGTVFVDVTDPSNPVYLGELPLHEGARPNLWRDMKVYRDHVFIVADNAGPHGMQVFDLTRLRNVTNRPARFTEDAHYAGIASAHNIAINEESGFAYPIGNSGGGETCGGALHMIDIRNPKNPTFAGCYADPATGNARTGYTHDAQCVTYHGPDTRYRGREVCFNASETAVGIAEVTDKQNPRPIAVAAYPNVGYSHQGWLTEDHRYFFLDDELDELAGTVSKTRTLVWDVANLEEPILVKEFLGTTGASDHNLYIRGNHVFQSNYVGGLRILDITDPKNPREVAHFDTVPFGENVPGFAGSWSNYPFFPSGTIVVTSMREGLFVLRHRPAALVP